MTEQRHISKCFHLGEYPEESGIMLIMPLLTRENMRKFLKKELLRKGTHCPNCGGLLPEIKLYYEDIEYSFTCTKIMRNRENLAETDCTKFAQYRHDTTPGHC